LTWHFGGYFRVIWYLFVRWKNSEPTKIPALVLAGKLAVRRACGFEKRRGSMEGKQHVLQQRVNEMIDDLELKYIRTIQVSRKNGDHVQQKRELVVCEAAKGVA
jgi:hypothetical protein